MDNSLKISKYIYTFLSGDTALTALVPQNRIVPVIALADTPLPYIVFARTETIPSYNKDGLADNEVIISIKVVDNEYGRGVDIVNEVRNRLEWKRYTDSDIIIDNIFLTSADESFNDDGYVQSLTFKITIRSN